MDKCPHCESPVDHHDAVADYTIFTCGSYCPPNYADEVVTTGLCETRKELQSVRAERDRLRWAIEWASRANCTFEDDAGSPYTICIGRIGGRHDSRVVLVPLSVLEESC